MLCSSNLENRQSQAAKLPIRPFIPITAAVPLLLMALELGAAGLLDCMQECTPAGCQDFMHETHYTKVLVCLEASSMDCASQHLLPLTRGKRGPFDLQVYAALPTLSGRVMLTFIHDRDF